MLLLQLLAIHWTVESRPAPGVKGGLVLPDGRLLVVDARRTAEGRDLTLHATTDVGRTWKPLGRIAHDDSPNADLGDGNLVRLGDGKILCVFRHNHHDKGDYAIDVAQSDDEGKTWRPHSTVDAAKPEGPGPSRGFWAPFLFVTGRGEVQCYYDNEYLPSRSGASGHQWVTMRAFRGGRWGVPTVAAREPDGLSRDGMASVVGLGGSRILCVVEAVRREAPHSGVLRGFVSEDDGKTWARPRLVYATKDPRFHAFAPSLIRVDGRLVVAFVTNEDRADTLPSGNPPQRLNLDVKAIVSADDGKTWSPSSLVYGEGHPTYLPSLAQLGAHRLFATFIDFKRGARSVEGRF